MKVKSQEIGDRTAQGVLVIYVENARVHAPGAEDQLGKNRGFSCVTFKTAKHPTGGLRGLTSPCARY